MTETTAALFLKDLAILFVVAALATVVFERLKLPLIAGYLVAGIVLGPHVGPALITDSGTVRVLAEVGVVLILGSVGLEFRLRRLLQLGPRVGLTAVIEVGFMLALGIGLASLLGWSRLERLLAGGIVAISSTAVIAKVFEERTVERPLKDLVFGILVMEDLVAIVLIAVAAAASLGSGLDVGSIGGVLLRMGGVLLAILAIGMLLVPRTIRAVVRLGRPETTLVTAVGLTFLVAVITESAGYSVALGAFLAGLLMAESGLGQQIVEVLKPVRDLFAAVFFVAVGMLLDVGAALGAWPLVLGFTAIVVLGKVSSVSVGAFLNGFGARSSIRAGMSLAQIGEFSFILAGLGGARSGGGAPLYSIAVATAMLTSFVTPWLVGRSDRTAAWIDRRLPAPLQTFSSLYGSWLEASAERRTARGSERTGRQQVWLIVVDAMLVAAILIGTSIGYRRGVPGLDRLVPSVSIARILVLALGTVLALPFALGLMLAIRRLARLVAEGRYRRCRPARSTRASLPASCS